VASFSLSLFFLNTFFGVPRHHLFPLNISFSVITDVTVFLVFFGQRWHFSFFAKAERRRWPTID
jgi:hypothetical protein